MARTLPQISLVIVRDGYERASNLEVREIAGSQQLLENQQNDHVIMYLAIFIHLLSSSSPTVLPSAVASFRSLTNSDWICSAVSSGI